MYKDIFAMNDYERIFSLDRTQMDTFREYLSRLRRTHSWRWHSRKGEEVYCFSDTQRLRISNEGVSTTSGIHEDIIQTLKIIKEIGA